MKKVSLINALGLVGCFLWVLAIFLRENSIMQNEIASFLLGVAPNFGVGLLIPMLVIRCFEVTLKKEVTCKSFILILIGIYGLLLMSEIIHDKFLNSRFDILDMVASLVALGIMLLSFMYKKADKKNSTETVLD